jgi:hypothetical protein
MRAANRQRLRLAARIPAESWEEDWRVMKLPGRMEKERAPANRLP